MNKTIMINSIPFEVKSTKNVEYLCSEILKNSGRDLSSCYARPSEAKKHIYQFWRSWYVHTPHVLSFGIRSYNSMMFTLSAMAYVNDVHYGLVITPSHNYAYVIPD